MFYSLGNIVKKQVNFCRQTRNVILHNVNNISANL